VAEPCDRDSPHWGVVLALWGCSVAFDVDLECDLVARRPARPQAEIDELSQDPREELAFHAQLADYAQALRHQGGGVTKVCQAGAPPSEWIST
jgi:hypothetical protein